MAADSLQKVATVVALLATVDVISVLLSAAFFSRNSLGWRVQYNDRQRFGGTSEGPSSLTQQATRIASLGGIKGKPDRSVGNQRAMKGFNFNPGFGSLLGFLLVLVIGVQGALVQPTPLVLDYHGGQLLTGQGSLLVYLVWYGDFTAAQKSIVTGFVESFAVPSSSPSPSGFWKIIASYADASGSHVRSSVKLGGQISLPSSSYGKKLKRAQLAEIITAVLASQALPAHPKSVYVLITSADVAVERFCMNSCATHSYINGSLATRGPRLPYAWVGNSATQCPGYCAWPFAKAAYGPPEAVPLRPPSGDVGMDGVVINLALMLAGAATNPFGRGYYQGDASAPLEAGTACQGIFGDGSYPGYPGELLVDKASGASYNAEGVRGAKYLLPAVWNPAKSACSTSF